MDGDGAISKVGTEAFEGGCEVVRVGGDKRVDLDISVLAAEITDLTCLGELRVTWGDLGEG